MAVTVADIRKKYPQYSDLSDEQLVQGMHRKFYADIPFDDFAKRVGFSAWQAPDVNALDVAGHMAEQVSQGSGEVLTGIGRMNDSPAGRVASLLPGSIPDPFGVHARMTGAAGEYLKEKSGAVRDFVGQTAGALTSALGFGDDTAEDVYQRTHAPSEDMQRSLQENVITGDITKPSTVSLGTNPTVYGMATNIGGTLARMAPVVAAARVNPVLGAAAGATQGYEGSRSEESDRIDQLPREQIVAMPRFRELIEEETGLPFDQGYASIAAASARLFDNAGTEEDKAAADAGARALQRLKDEAGHSAGLWAAPLGVLQGFIFTGKVGGALASKIRGASAGVLGGVRAVAGTTAGATVGGLGEATTEVAQKVAQAYGATTATGEQGRVLTEDTAADAILGFGPGVMTNVSVPKRQSVTDRVFGGPGIQAGDVLGDVGNDSAPIKAEKGPMTPGGRGYTFDESGNVVEERAGLALPPPDPVAPVPGTGIGPAGPREGADPVDFIVDPEGGPSAPGDWRARAEARRARTGGPGMGPVVDGEPTMAPDDMAQAAFDTAMETAKSAMGRAPSKSSANALASRIAERFGVDPAALIERNRNPVRTQVSPAGGVQPEQQPEIGNEEAGQVGTDGQGQEGQGQALLTQPATVAAPAAAVAPATPAVEPAPPAEVPRGRMFRQGNNAEAVQAPNGTWYTRRRVAGRWQPWQRRRSFDPSGAHGYSPYQPPSGNVRTPAGVIRVGDDRREAKPTGPRPPNDVIQVIAAAGGINREAARRAGVDPAMLQRRVGIRPLFPINGGMPLNGMRELLTSEGFFPPDDPNAPPTVSDDDAFEVFNRALQGERIVSPNRAAEEAAYQASQRSAGTAQAEAGQLTTEARTDDDERLAAEFLSRVESDPVASRIFGDFSAEEDAEAMEIVELAERAMQLGATPAEVRQAYNAQGDAELARNLWELIRTKEIANGPDAREGQARDRNGDQAQPGGLEAARDAAQRQPAAGNEGASASRPVESVGQAESEEVTRLRGEVSRLRRELDTDSLTGVKSRSAYSRDNPKAKGVAFIDVIAFKGYNTKFTETGGDAVLQAFGRVMLEVAGEQAYRRGGDEFAILSSESPEHAREIAKRVFDAMAQERLLLVDKEGVEYEIAGIPFRTGIGATDAEATADSAARKLAGDRESNPNVQRRASDADVGRSGAVPGPDVRGQGGVPGRQEDRGLTNEPQSDDQAGGRDGQGASAAVERGEATVRGADPGRGERPAESAGAWNPGNDRGVRNDGLAQAGPERADAAPVAPRRNDDTPADPLALSDETAVTPPPAAPRPPSQNGLFGQVTPMDVDRLNYERAQSEARTDPSRAPRPPASDTVDIEQQIAREAQAAPRPQNTIFTEDAAARAREILRRNLGRTSNMLDPEVVQAGLTLAGYHIEAGARRFADFVRAMVADLGEEVRPYLKSWYMAAKYDPRVSASPFASELSGAAEVESANVEAIGADDVSSANINLERDRGNTVDQASAVEAAVPNVERPASSGTGSDRESFGARGRRRARSSRVSADGSAVDGDSGNLALFGGERVDQPALVPSGADNDQRGGGFGDTGIPVESAAASEAARPTDQGAPEFRKRAEQRAADGVAIKVGNLANIRETLPYLLPGQQEDVYKAEQRFAKPDGYGMLFTNGTGTGKTFTGLGIVKRFARQGKTNTIIVAPSDKIIEDWINSGKALGLNITRLDGTNDAGNGIVITTYAAFGQNRTLADRQWDLVVPDEAHYLAQAADGEPTSFLQNLRAITKHPDGYFTRTNMIHRDLADRIAALSGDLRGEASPALKALYREIEAKRDAVKADVMASQGAARTRAAFLSATPFAYEKAIDWANGYLFDYNEGQESDAGRMGYNSGNNRERFFMLNFGYRMRYNKLTQPDANVDTGVMQRQFNAKLKRDGSLSSRILDVAADYDRKFILTESAIGARIDAALQWIRDHDSDKSYDLQKLISDRFDHLSRRYLLEAIKAEEVIPLIREHMALGRKVVVFHDYKKGGGFNPFDIPHTNDKLLDSLIDEFRAEFRDLVNYPFQSMPSPIIAFQREFPSVLLFNGDVSPKDRRANVAKFNDDASGPQVILVQSAAGKEGISLHDTTGKHQRVLFNLGLPTQPTTAIQQEGRIYRTGQVTNALFRYLNTGTNWERWAFATTIATRSSTAENLALGEQARALRDAFISGFEESDNYRAGDEGEGIGGKERDRAANEALTEFDRARSFYFGTQKKNSRTKAQEGTDYFATPEPLGLKMVEWADIRPGETALEPSAGHGAIARWFPETNKVTAIEPSAELAARLAMVRGDQNTRIEQARFEDHNIVNKYDVIVMNPPFGSGGRTAIDHLDKAARHLRDGGRIVALIPTGPAADAKFQKWFFESSERAAKPLATHPTLGPIYKGDTLTISGFGQSHTLVVAHVDGPVSGPQFVRADGVPKNMAINMVAVKKVDPTGSRTEGYNAAAGLHLTADIELPAVTFERAGTQVRTRVLVIDKIGDGANPGQSSRDYTDAATIKEFFDRIENATIPARTKPRVEPEEAPPAAPAPRDERAQARAQAKEEKQSAAQAGEKIAQDAGEPIVEHVTAKGKTLRGVVRSISMDEAKALDAYTFRKNGGFFIRLENLAPKDGMASVPGWESIETDTDRLSDDTIDREVSKARAEFGDAVTIEVMDSINDSPASDRTKRLYPGAHGLTDGKSNVWIFRKALQGLQALRTTLAHEIIGHIGVERVIGADWPAVMDAIKRIREGKLFASPAVVNAIRSAESRYPGADDLTFAREAVAIMAERGITGALWDRIVAAVRRYLRKVFGSLQWSESEVRDLLRRAGEAARKPAVMKGAKFEAAQVVFHGTPHTVDRFSLQKIGTGEGAQAYGWGMYFASKKEVAESYKRVLEKREYDIDDPAGIDASFWMQGVTRQQAIQNVESALANPPRSANAKVIADWKADLAYLKSDKPIPQVTKRSGNLYRVEVPEDSDLLDWDKPLSEQPEKVREALKASGVVDFDNNSLGDGLGFVPKMSSVEMFTGEKLYRRIVDREFEKELEVTSAARKSAERGASEYLNSIGIPGLRYLDGTSRNKGEGSHNYVIWSEEAIGEPTMLASNPEPAKPFFSALVRSIDDAKGAPKRANADAWSQWIDGAQRRGEFKQSERDWIGVDAWLRGRDSTTREELAEFVRANAVQVREVVLGGEAAAWNVYNSNGEFEERFDSEAEANAAAEKIGGDVRETAVDRASNGAGAKFASYQLPGGQNYRELLLTLPVKTTLPNGFSLKQIEAGPRKGQWAVLGPGPLSENRYGLGATQAEAIANFGAHGHNGPTYKSSHFDQPNILAHVRFNERADADGKRVLFVEEVQSDWNQAGRKKGYKEPLPSLSIPNVDVRTSALSEQFDSVAAGESLGSYIEARQEQENELARSQRTAPRIIDNNTPAQFQYRDGKIMSIRLWPTVTDDVARQNLSRGVDRINVDHRDEIARKNESRVPDAPLKKEWPLTAMKRMIRWAAENGFDKIAWTTGEQQAERYDLSKQIEFLDYRKNTDGTYELQADARNRQGAGNLEIGTNIPESDLEKHVGKEVAQKIIDGVGEHAGGQKGTRFAWKRLEGGNLKIGGEGMRAFYDKMLPNELGKYVKKWGAKVGQTDLSAPGNDAYTITRASVSGKEEWRVWDADDNVVSRFPTKAEAKAEADKLGAAARAKTSSLPVHSIDLTPAMRDAAMQGQPLFSNPAQGPIERQMAEDARAGQPIDKLFRLPFHLFGLDSHGRLKPGTKLYDWLTRVVAEKMPAEDGAFGWAIPIIKSVRSGLIDRYGVPQDFVQRDERRESEVRSVLMHAARVASDLEGLTTAEAKVLQAMLTGQEMPVGELGKLSQPIKEAIDQMGREAVELGLISPEAYERNRGAYLHRSYLKYEADRTPLGKAIGSFLDKRRKKLLGDTLRRRGMTMERDTGALAAALGGAVREGDTVTVLRQKTEAGGVRTKYQRGPLNGPAPVGWENLGDWRVMGFDGKKAKLWRDFTPAEREKMGEILDARYNITKTFALMAHDLATGRFLRDIAANPDWARADLPEGATAAEARGRYDTYADSEWVRVPDAAIPGTNDGKGNPVKRWGELAGMYVRAPIWRDLNQLREMQNPQVWGSVWNKVLTFWKTNKTARNPVVHVNNVMSNMMFMDLADIRLRDLYRAIGAWRRGESDDDYRDAMANGAFGGGFADQELKRKVLQPILDDILAKQKTDGQDTAEDRLGVLHLLSTIWDGIKKVDGKMLDAYNAEDEIFRLAFYLRRQSLGDTPEEAARAARRQFIDYDIRAPWVNAARNTVLPFIGYTYRSIPILAQAIAERPWKLAKYATLAAAANWLGYLFAPGDEDDERKVMAPAVQGTTWTGTPRMIRMPWYDADGNPVFLDVRRWIPAGDVFDMNQSEIGLPAWLQFGGPLQIAGELMLNKQAFTKQPIVDPLTDATGEKAAKLASWGWKAFAPNAPWIPESYSWDKIAQAITGETDELGRDFSVIEAASSVLGIKAAGMDVDLQRRYRAREFDRVERELDFDLTSLKREYQRKKISQPRFKAAEDRIYEKKRALAEERRRVLSRTSKPKD